MIKLYKDKKRYYESKGMANKLWLKVFDKLLEKWEIVEIPKWTKYLHLWQEFKKFYEEID